MNPLLFPGLVEAEVAEARDTMAPTRDELAAEDYSEAFWKAMFGGTRSALYVRVKEALAIRSRKNVTLWGPKELSVAQWAKKQGAAEPADLDAEYTIEDMDAKSRGGKAHVSLDLTLSLVAGSSKALMASIPALDKLVGSERNWKPLRDLLDAAVGVAAGDAARSIHPGGDYDADLVADEVEVDKIDIKPSVDKDGFIDIRVTAVLEVP